MFLGSFQIVGIRRDQFITDMAVAVLDIPESD